MQFLAIIFLSIAAAILYGIAHDLITTRICIEYFTLYHPPVFGGITDPTQLAFAWGVLATWWVGLLLGLPLAAAARVGNMPKRSALSLIRPIAILLAAMAAGAFTAGLIAYLYATSRPAPMWDPISSGLPISHQAGFLVNAAAHLTSYAAGFLGGIILIAWTLYARYRALRRTIKLA